MVNCKERAVFERGEKMSEDNKKAKSFGFTRFRFVVAAILLIAAGLKAYQLAAIPLPPVVQGSMFTPLLELLNNRYLPQLLAQIPHID